MEGLHSGKVSFECLNDRFSGVLDGSNGLWTQLERIRAASLSLWKGAPATRNSGSCRSAAQGRRGRPRAFRVGVGFRSSPAPPHSGSTPTYIGAPMQRYR